MRNRSVNVDWFIHAVAGFEETELLRELIDKSGVEMLHRSPINVRHTRRILIRIGILDVRKPQILKLWLKCYFNKISVQFEINFVSLTFQFLGKPLYLVKNILCKVTVVVMLKINNNRHSNRSQLII